MENLVPKEGETLVGFTLRYTANYYKEYRKKEYMLTFFHIDAIVLLEKDIIKAFYDFHNGRDSPEVTPTLNN